MTVYEFPLPVVLAKDVGGAQYVIDRFCLSRDTEPPAL